MTERLTVSTRLALIERGIEADAKTRGVEFLRLEGVIATLTSKVDAAISVMQEQSAEAEKSPAGRTILVQLADLKKTVGEHDDFVQQMTGGLRLARFALGTSFLSAIGTVVLAAVMLSGAGP